MTKIAPDTLSIRYPYGIDTPLAYGMDTVSIHKRLETRDKETGDRITPTSHTPQGSLAFENSQHPKQVTKGSQKRRQRKQDYGKGLHVFTDGSCDPNPGPGGWAFVAIENGKPVHSEKGFRPVTTNNRMEMQAVIAALTWMQANNLSHAKLHTDSAYCEKGANAWRHGWKSKAWTRGEALIPNADLWQAMSAILDAFPISLHRVRGHSGIAGNEQADRMAAAALQSGVKERSAA